MKKTNTKKTICMIAVLLFTFVMILSVRTTISHASKIQPFKKLSIGSLNIKPLTKRIFYERYLDGVNEINLYGYGYFKAGDIFRWKPKKGFKTRVKLIYSLDGINEISVKVKKKSFVMPCNSDQLNGISILMKKGGKYSSICLYYDEEQWRTENDENYDG